MYEMPVESFSGLKTIGYAGMKFDGTIFLRVRSKGINAGERSLIYCAPGDDNYAQIFAHLGGISPGQTERITPFVA